MLLFNHPFEQQYYHVWTQDDISLFYRACSPKIGEEKPQSSREARIMQFVASYCTRPVQGNARYNYGHIKVAHLRFAIDALGVARLDCLQVSPKLQRM